MTPAPEPAGGVFHLAYPLRQVGGRLAVVEQDTLEHVTQCVHVLAITPVGVRPLAPEVGVDDPTFTDLSDPEEIAAQIERWEERASVSVEVSDPDGTGAREIDLHVELAVDVDELGEGEEA